MTQHARWFVAIPLSLFAIAAVPAAHAALSQVAVTVFAQDSQTPGYPSTGPLTDGDSASAPPVVAASITATAGAATAHGEAQVDGLAGIARLDFSAAVLADRYQVGRNAAVYGGLFMGGSIGLAGAAPGLATFTAVLDGSYGTVGSPLYSLPLDNTVGVTYELYIGSSGPLSGRLDYACCNSGTFSVPFTWTQAVSPGEVIDFSLYLNATVGSLQGSAAFDASNTFRITGIDLPDGYSYAPDAGGFLSQFAAPVPEPAGTWLMAIGLIGVTLVRRGAVLRRRWHSLCVSVESQSMVLRAKWGDVHERIERSGPCDGHPQWHSDRADAQPLPG